MRLGSPLAVPLGNRSPLSGPVAQETRTYAELSGKTRFIDQSGAKSRAQRELAILWVEITAHPLTQNGRAIIQSIMATGRHTQRIHVERGPAVMARRWYRSSLDQWGSDERNDHPGPAGSWRLCLLRYH